MPKPWVKNAPDYLINGFERRRFGGIARPLFKRLLQDERMRLAWAELARHVGRVNRRDRADDEQKTVTIDCSRHAVALPCLLVKPQFR